MSTVLSEVEWDACVLEPRRDRELEAFVRRELGVLPSSVVYFTAAPWIVRSMADLSDLGAPRLHMDAALADLVGLVVSQDNSCRYCYGVQRMMMRVHGIADSRIREIEQNLVDSEIDPHAKAALDFARRVSRGAPLVSGADVGPLLANGWSPVAVRELAFHALQNLYMNRLMTLAAVPYTQPERLAASPFVRIAAPLLRFLLRRRHRLAHERAVRLAPDRQPGRFEYLVRALEDLPVARPLRETIDQALESEVLSRRSKALIFAVVARGLGCEQAASESSALLRDAGFGDAQVEQTLTHLGAPDLEPVENAVVTFARSTIRGRPVQLQQRTRALLGTLTADQLVEAVGIASLANLVCRLGLVTEVR